MADANSRAGERYDTPEIIAYLNHLHASHDEGLASAFEAPDRHGMPAIQVGMSEGKLLTLLLRMIGAKYVLEIGTLAGYSAIRMAQALPADGHLTTLELDHRHAIVAKHNIQQAGFANEISVVEGSALQWLEIQTSLSFDTVFIDADKGNYDKYLRYAANLIRPGGLLLVDNAYLFGRLLEDSEEAAAVRRCHEEAAQAFDTVCIPTPDGLLLGIKR